MKGQKGELCLARGPEGDAGDWSAMVAKGEDETEAGAGGGLSTVD